MTDVRRAVLAALAADGPLDTVELAERIDDHPLTSSTASTPGESAARERTRGRLDGG